MDFLTIKKLFSQDLYAIPDYQRDYERCWHSGTGTQDGCCDTYEYPVQQDAEV